MRLHLSAEMTFQDRNKNACEEAILATRLSYNCAHLGWTKETLTIEYFRIILKKIWVTIFLVKTFGVKIFGVKFFFGDNFFGENFFG